MPLELPNVCGSSPAWHAEARPTTHPVPCLLSCRDVRHSCGHLAGPLAAAVAGELGTCTSIVSMSSSGQGPGHCPHPPGALGDGEQMHILHISVMVSEREPRRGLQELGGDGEVKVGETMAEWQGIASRWREGAG